jgi:hypothetical protein
MRDRELKDLLQKNIESPDRASKDAFIRKYEKEKGSGKSGLFQMLFMQAGYIRKRIWAASVLIAVISFFFSGGMPEDRLYVMAGLMPFMAGLVILEVFRSEYHAVSELEAVTKFSAKGVSFARMTLISAFQLMITMVMAVIFGKSTEYGITVSASILLVPWLITSAAGLILERSEFGRSNRYSFMGVAVIVTCIHIALSSKGFFENMDMRYMVLAAALLLAVNVFEVRKTIETETLVWN